MSIIHGIFNRRARLGCDLVISRAGGLAARVMPSGASTTTAMQLSGASNGGSTKIMRHPTPDSLSSRLGQGCSFSGFVRKVDGGLPHSIKRTVTRRPGRSAFGPLFVCKPSKIKGARLIGTVNTGVGRLRPRGHILCISTRLFRIRCASSIEGGAIGSFVGFCRAVSILVISSMRRFTALAEARGAFFRVFGRLRLGKHRLVLASSEPPATLRKVRRHLLAHFG